jgi:hypothetical protein
MIIRATVGAKTGGAFLMVALAFAGGCASKSPAAPASPAEVAAPPVEGQQSDVPPPVDAGPVLPPGLAPMPIADDTARPPPPSTTVATAVPAPPAGEPAAGPAPPPEPVIACTALRGNAVKRSALIRTLDAGLGAWLSGVDIEPKVDRGRFRGWLIQTIYAGDPCWTEVDLRAGDVVVKVNRRPIHSPDEAQAVWTALRGAREIVVDFLREGKARTLRFPVVDDRE